ncbi:hypothetical protein SEA_MOLIVIA_88 [Arthrobacter phage Molivia]|uniref:Uncharacterized protein n=1 Tax=Arthrobacter phage Molivia TaxID=2015839 RepID=A0A286S1U3_9CAUD|nr:hypothetical protein FDI28_gp28 [Arthrobacter phage Molivia]ASX99309.1 hypothetical protein SEA_MOLIVIA_88 [Arthrobacter phage Molivia]
MAKQTHNPHLYALNGLIRELKENGWNETATQFEELREKVWNDECEFLPEFSSEPRNA